MNIILEMKFGSHLYGTNTENSDVDYKGIYIPDSKDIIMGTYKKTINITRSKEHGERNTKNDIDIEYFSLDRFLELLTQGQTVALDILFGFNREDCKDEESFDLIRKIYIYRNRILSKNVNAFLGYAKAQAAKYGIKGSRLEALTKTMELLNTFKDHDKLLMYEESIIELVKNQASLISLEKTQLIDLVVINNIKHLVVCNRKLALNQKVKTVKDIIAKILAEYGSRARMANIEGGIDWKALSHAVRVNSEALELLRHSFITFPRPDKQLLLDIKLGKLPYEEVAILIEEGLEQVVIASNNSDLRETPDIDWAKNLIYEVYLNTVLTSNSK